MKTEVEKKIKSAVTSLKKNSLGLSQSPNKFEATNEQDVLDEVE
jgi:hypothetical protein